MFEPLWLLVIIPLALASIFVFVQIALFLRSLFSSTKYSLRPLPNSTIQVPAKRTISWKDTSPMVREILRDWSSGDIPSWKEDGKVEAPRVLLAKLQVGTGIDDVNSYLLGEKPWGKTGSTWFLNPDGDYDFTLTVLTSILHLFGDDGDRLHPETRAHLIDVLLSAKGHKRLANAPRSLGLVIETENHVLMTESSRYLRAKWLSDHSLGGPGTEKDLEITEEYIRKMLDRFLAFGFYEFNSDPYSAYTVTALLNLEAFGSDWVSDHARALLDRIFFQYALGSSKLRRAAPFRRQLSRAGDNRLDKDLISAFMRVYVSLHPKGPKRIEHGERLEHSLMACVLPYRPPSKLMAMVMGDEEEHFVKMGHGRNSSPEIYSKGRGFLISAGGVQGGVISRIVSRPITLMIDDDARDMKDVIHMYGPGRDFRRWNNTGVHRRFAVCAGPVRIPKGWKPDSRSRIWKIYRRNGSNIAVHSTEHLGIIAILDGSLEEAQFGLDHLNHDERTLKFTFEFPGGDRIGYDVLASRNRWVITTVGKVEADRKFDRWPLLEGTINK